MIPGHEFVGRVVEIGDKVKGNWKIGDRICPEQIVPCGECMFCKTGRHWMCEKHDLFGFQNNVNGGMAEYVRLTKEALPYLVPADMPVEKGCSDRAICMCISLCGQGTAKDDRLCGAVRSRNTGTWNDRSAETGKS